MRSIVLVAALLGCLSLTACNDKPAAPAAEAPAPKKSLARQAPLYAGQEQVQSIQSGTVTADASGGLNLAAKATTDGAGWTQVGFLPRVYAGSPPDGIYEVDVVAQKPAAPGAAGPTPVEASAAWDKYKDGRVKGVKFLSKTNEVVAMVGG
ncbi:hypothetical protein [uncultured Phenylobacterium sp.]|uniref:hypothetical protein n=1 Tax=uncultured Phenylobacterium sp. TaxID=349273 RepID=UPI0025FF5348|nr:hypothetical protein [uncultured Phenylobacterium sp.]